MTIPLTVAPLLIRAPIYSAAALITQLEPLSTSPADFGSDFSSADFDT